MRTDRRLAELLKAVTNAPFVTNLEPEERDRVGDATEYSHRRKRIAWCRLTQRYRIQICMCSSAYVFGSCPRDNTQCLQDLCRIADILTLETWAYKVRGASKPTDEHLNFSVARAQQDLKEYPAVADAVCQLTAYMKSVNLLVNREAIPKARYRRAKVGPALATIMEQLTELRKVVDAMSVGQQRHQENLNDITEKLFRERHAA